MCMLSVVGVVGELSVVVVGVQCCGGEGNPGMSRLGAGSLSTNVAMCQQSSLTMIDLDATVNSGGSSEAC